MRIRTLLTALFILVASNTIIGQTSTLTWDHPQTTVAQANAFNTTVIADGNLITAARSCVQVGTTATCSVPIPLITNGQHVYSVESIIGGVAHRAVANVTWPVVSTGGQGPTAPRLTIIVTVNVGGSF